MTSASDGSATPNRTRRRFGSVVGDPRAWGVSAEEMARDYPCDAVLTSVRDTWFRGVDVRAPASVVYRWLCQLRVAPYSYDLLDNLGRRSPRTLTPGVEDLRVGNSIMYIFELVSFTPGRDLTVRLRSRPGRWLFGEFAVTYDVRDLAPGHARLVSKLMVGGPSGGLHEVRRRALAWGDLVMMRKQLLRLRDLVEGPAESSIRP